jgi:hypothetical protein
VVIAKVPNAVRIGQIALTDKDLIMKTDLMRFVTLLAVICIGAFSLALPLEASIYDSNVIEQLQLTGDQKQEMQKAIDTSRAQRNRIFKKYGIDPNARPQKSLLQSASSELMANAARERAAAKKILTRKQMYMYDTIIAKTRQKIMASF